MKRYVRLFEEEYKPESDIKEGKSPAAFISPDGRVFNLKNKPWTHSAFAKTLNKGQYDLIDDGWVHLSSHVMNKPIFSTNRINRSDYRLTKEQLEVIIRWSKKHGIKKIFIDDNTLGKEMVKEFGDEAYEMFSPPLTLPKFIKAYG